MFCKLRQTTIHQFTHLLLVSRAHATTTTIPTMTDDFYRSQLNRFKYIVPRLDAAKHKGQAGRIGVVGGSLEYTGAPYFAAISALRVGADLVHIFCAAAAGPVIKAYSPELIVHPILDDRQSGGVHLMLRWLERLHVLIIGPGLGRDASTLETVSALVHICKRLEKPLVLDADGLYWASQNIELIRDYPGLILTPNAVEFKALFNSTTSREEAMRFLGSDVTILQKGLHDQIWHSGGEAMIEANEVGSSRRCGGQGDLLCGVVATFYCWGLLAQLPADEAAVAACCAASFLAKQCNRRAFSRLGRSMLASDMVEEVGKVFSDHFERDSSE